MQIPKRRSEQFKVYDTGPVHVTKAKFEQMEAKLEELKRSLPHLISETERTAAYGDRSENAEYKDAKANLRRTHRQVYLIQDQLRRAIIVQSGATSLGTIRIGSRVTLEVNGEKKMYEILGSKETDPAQGKISFSSPLGAALMDRTIGEHVTIKTPNGSRTYTVLDIQ